MNQQLNRRALLSAGLLTGVGACTSAPPAAAPTGGSPAPPLKADDWASVRAQFDLPKDRADFAAFVLARHPAEVRRAIEEHRRGLDADPEYLPAGGNPDQAVREAAARYLGGAPAQIVLTDSTTMGLALLYGGIKLLPGQDVLTTEHDFLATHEALRLRTERTGAAVRRVRLYDEPAKASVDEIAGRLRKAIGPKTRIVAVTWVHSSTGVRLPVKEMAAVVAEANKGREDKDRALLCVDGVHGFGALADGAEDLGCDFLASGTHKWLCGPRGTGIVWGRAWEAVVPLIPSFGQASFDYFFEGSSQQPVTAEYFTPGGYKAFEHRWAAGAAFAFQEAIGKDRVQARIQELATRLKSGLAGVAHVKLATPVAPELSAGLVCMEVDGIASPYEAVGRLREQHRIVASSTPYRESLLRLGTTIMNTPEEVDRAVKAVAALR
ncbi:aminotransferase class V-fold PLP-dependent enzyme [Nonomuraea sp. NPDC050394]|uniref:aminotransferase class V-fold PLP-dependent enzyme n=1 Tax=Nonomuraea sp. NPDC050394 TaxID=3364363 RepID=UPI0037A1B780